MGVNINKLECTTHRFTMSLTNYMFASSIVNTFTTVPQIFWGVFEGHKKQVLWTLKIKEVRTVCFMKIYFCRFPDLPQLSTC